MDLVANRVGRAAPNVRVAGIPVAEVHISATAGVWRAKDAAWDDHVLIFSNALGRHLESNNINRGGFRPIKNASGVPDFRFHDLRHTAASELLLEGVPAKVISEMLGHTSIGITLNIYNHVLPTMQRSAAAMNRLFG